MQVNQTQANGNGAGNNNPNFPFSPTAMINMPLTAAFSPRG